MPRLRRRRRGRPPYDPADLLKLYLYGYLNQIRSSVALMTEMEIDHHVRGETEARLMKTAQGPSRVAYNVQSAVDAEHGLILHHEVTQEASDNRQLAPMADAAKAVLAQAQLTVVADAGYSNGEHLTHCAEAQVTAFVPPERAVNNQAEGTLFQKRDFSYDAGQDAYRCPAGAGSSANRSPTRTGSSFTPPQRVQAARAGTLPGPSGDDETAPGHRRTPLRKFEGARLR